MVKEMNEGVATSQQIKSRKKGKKTKELKVDIAGLFSFVNRSYRWMDVGVLKEKKMGFIPWDRLRPHIQSVRG